MKKDKILYDELENILDNYNNIKIEIKNARLEIEEIESEYLGASAINYDEKTGQTNKFSSVVENEVLQKEKLVNRLEKEIESKQRLIQKIDNSLETLLETERKVIEYKFFKRLQYKEIEQLLGMDRNYCCDLKRRTVEKLIPLVFIKEKLKE